MSRASKGRDARAAVLVDARGDKLRAVLPWIFAPRNSTIAAEAYAAAAAGLEFVEAGSAWEEIAVETARLGVTDLRFGQAAGKFGSTPQQAVDLERLGAKVVRNLGAIELTWEALVGAASPVPDSREEVIAEILGRNNANVATVASLFETLSARGLKAVLRCPMGTSRKTEGFSTWGLAEPLELQWAPEHGSYVEHFDILDVRSTYQVQFLGYMAEGVATLLGRVAGLLPSVRLSDVVYAIELFPEADERNVEPPEGERPGVGDSTANGVTWGFAWWYVANMLTAALADLDEPLSFRLMLPAITSHYETVLDDQGTLSRHSLDYFLAFFASLLGTVTGLESLGGLVVRDAVLAVNYGWDHGNVGRPSDTGVEREGPLHMAHLATELAEVRAILDGFGLSSVALSVLDTGQSVTDDDEYVPEWAGGREWLQGVEVWRRVPGALACGAALAGWRSWMSRYTERAARDSGAEGYGRGLRHDDPAPVLAYEATPRTSWYAYARVADTLAGLGEATLLYPNVNLTSDWSNQQAANLLVYRFCSSLRVRQGPSGPTAGRDYAYILLPDLTSAAGEAWNVTVQWATEAGAASGSCRRRAALPTRIPEADAGIGTGLPEPKANWAPDETVALATILYIAAGDAPVVLLSDHALAFVLSTVSETEPPPDPKGGPPVDTRPPWMKWSWAPVDAVYVDGIRVK